MPLNELIFATHNTYKAKEIQELLGSRFFIKTLTDIGLHEEIPETKNSLEGNAQQKAQYVFDQYKTNVFSDDTGLEVAALNGDPGVLSARYAGLQKDSGDNIDLLLLKLKGVKDRSAQFRTVISLFWNGNTYLFEGVVRGKICLQRQGLDGFGYDPIFLPNGYSQTFAEMNLSLKNKISHRGLAVQKMIRFLTR
ncbi:MAG: XTP/dITP diphosphohydrolase [bacterium]|jgi:XTP/dITP diphosphohydrolase